MNDLLLQAWSHGRLNFYAEATEIADDYKQFYKVADY